MKSNWKSRMFHILLFSFVMVMFLVAYGAAYNTRNTEDTVKLRNNWTIKYNDNVSENVDLTSFRFPVAKKGDWIVMTSTLPEDMPEHSTMLLYMVFSVVRVYVDGEEVYEYGLDDYDEGTLLGYGTDFVALPDECAGKNIKITMFVTENNAFSSITTPIIYNSSSVFQSFYSNKLFPLAVAITLIVVGLCIAIVTFILYFKSYSMEKLFCVGVFSICVGCWSLCNYNINYIVSANLKLKVYIEYFSLYLVLFPMLLYFREDIEARKRRWESFIYYALMLVEIQLFLISCICQLTNLVHFPVFLRVFHVLMAVVAVFIGYITVFDFMHDKNHRILSLGLVILLAISIRDLVAYNITKYVARTGAESDYKSYLAAGALIVVVAMLVDFINTMRKQMIAAAENQFLEKIAYIDVLTDLYTRRKCEDIFKAIDLRNYEFAIIQFDLNNLKSTNDDFGHEAGDELIRRFAASLRGAFNSGETLGRMGGDEFVVMVTDAYDYDIEGKIAKLDALIEADNAEHEDVKVSVSLGYCLSKELDHPTAHDVYMEADKRMYAEKEKYYKKRGYTRRRYDKA